LPLQTRPPAKHGFILQTTVGLATADLPIGPLTFSVSSSGNASWRMAFSGGLEFTPPIQLSFGFTLVGVGGLAGINRRPDTEALRAAAHSGDLSNLLFPRDLTG
jgi:hypothetical protein